MSIESEPFGVASLNRRDDPDEFGMTAGQFDKSQAELRRTVDAIAGAEREKSHREYYIFDTPLEKERAAKLVVECRQYEDASRYLDNWHDDKIHPDIGLGLEFSKSPQDSEANIMDFFSRNNLQAKRIHHTDSQLQETAVYAKDPEAEQQELGQQAKVLPFSRMRKMPSKQAPEEETYTKAV